MTSAARTARSSPRKSSRHVAQAGGSERLLKIGEAAKLLGMEAYVLRFWETQFSFLRPRHSRSKHRFYGEQDLETLRLIKRLLHEERFTIAGAKKYIREVGLKRALSAMPGVAAAHLDAGAASTTGAGREPSASEADSNNVRRAMAEVRRDLESLHKLLET